MADVLAGLHAAHELADDEGRPLGVVHRDVSPHNVHVGTDGLSRVLDFGIAKAAGRRHQTRTGEVKGKLAYMAPEQLFGEAVDRRADIYAAGVVLWEALTGRRLFDASNEGALVLQVTEGRIDPPSLFADEPVPEALDRVILKALAKKPEERWATAEDMARALTDAIAPAPRTAVKDAVLAFGGEQAEARARIKGNVTPTPGMLEPEARAVLDVLTQQVHVARTEPPAPAKSRGSQALLGVAILLAIALVGVVATAFVLMRASKSGPAGEPAVVSSTTGSIVSAAPSAAPPPDPSSEPAPSESAAPPIASASASAPRPHRPGKKPAPPKPPAEPAAARTQITPRPDCQPPYTVDAEGHRHYKAECVSPP